MIEIIIGLSAIIVILIAFSISMLRSNAKLSAEIERSEKAFDAIMEAQSAIDKQIAQEVSRHEEDEKSISDRSYFG